MKISFRKSNKWPDPIHAEYLRRKEKAGKTRSHKTCRDEARTLIRELRVGK